MSKTNTNDEPQIDTALSMQDVARLTGVSISTVHGWCSRYGLSSTREGKARMIPTEELADFLREKGYNDEAFAIKLKTSIGADLFPKLVDHRKFLWTLMNYLREEHQLSHEAALTAGAHAGLFLGYAMDELLDGPFVQYPSDCIPIEIMQAHKAGTLHELAARWWPKEHANG